MERSSCQLDTQFSSLRLEVSNTRKQGVCTEGACEKEGTDVREGNSENVILWRGKSSVPWEMIEAFDAFSIAYVVTTWFETSVTNHFTNEKILSQKSHGTCQGHKATKR